jgi:Peptidase family M23/CARDB
MKSKLQGLLALGVTILLFALVTESASAVGEQITINPTSGPPGTTVTVNGSGWQDHASRGWDVPVQINGVTLATAHPDANGNFSVRITIPESAAPGSRVRIDALLGNGGSASAWFDVTEPASGSPGGSTGNDIDLEVIKIKPLGQRICAGSKKTFQASIRNKGSSESGFFNIQWIADDAKRFDGGHYSIPAESTDTHDHKWKKLSAGKHNLVFIADFDKQKSETDEKNNRFTLTFRADKCSSTPTQPPSTPKQPSLTLPWSPTDGATTWYYSGGPHCDPGYDKDGDGACASGAQRYAVDFMPPRSASGGNCSPDRINSGWVVAAGKGEVRYASGNLVEIDHGDGFRTGYYHLKSGTIQVHTGDPIDRVGTKLGRPSCEAGAEQGAHVHFYICNESDPDKVCRADAKKGTSIDGLVIGGWTIHSAKKNYNGTMTKPKEDARTAEASVCDPGKCGKIRNDLTR